MARRRGTNCNSEGERVVIKNINLFKVRLKIKHMKETYTKEEVLSLLEFVNKNYHKNGCNGPWNKYNYSLFDGFSHKQVLKDFEETKLKGLAKKVKNK